MYLPVCSLLFSLSSCYFPVSHLSCLMRWCVSIHRFLFIYLPICLLVYFLLFSNLRVIFLFLFSSSMRWCVSIQLSLFIYLPIYQSISPSISLSPSLSIYPLRSPPRIGPLLWRAFVIVFLFSVKLHQRIFPVNRKLIKSDTNKTFARDAVHVDDDAMEVISCFE